ncbi:MAG: ABC transporter ATP-binding protein [Ignavibacteriae bacterium]|nr:ABC transporter ATP-binding protein [Ignavibacteriota bacterium]
MITIHSLGKSYGDKRALNGISFEIRKGEICGYIGPNGAGKSTTVKILTGILKPDSGSATVGSIDVVKDPDAVKPLLGYVPETGSVFESLTPSEYLLFAGRMHGMSDGLIRKRSALLLEYFGLRDASASIMTTFSKGMRQKVIIATALLHNPPVYFFDEPLDGLDAHSTVLFKELIHHLARRGGTILYCSHLLDIVERVCHRIIILKNGTIVAQGNIEQLRELTQQDTLEEAFGILTESEEVEEKTVRLLDNLAAAGG